MEDRHRDLINQHFDELVEKTHDIDKVVKDLVEKEVLNNYMKKNVTKYPDQKRQLIEFYRLIQARGPSAFADLLMTLKKTNNLQAEDILKTDKVSYFIEKPPPIMNTTTPITHTNDHKDGNLIYHGITTKDLIVKIHPQGRFMDVDEDNQPCGVFRMRSRPRGCALIININNIPQMRERKGSQVDVENLNKLFTQLGYDITIRPNLSKKEMKKEIRKFATDEKLSEVDSCIVFAMSHGCQPQTDENVQIIASDKKGIPISWILSQFTSTNSKLITASDERKPKMFFFQACRVLPSKIPFNTHYSPADTDSDIYRSNTLDQREMEDMLIVHSTVTGQYSLRDTVTGSWFVDEFCKVVAKNAWQYDLETMLNQVDEQIRKEKKDPTLGSQTMDVKKLGCTKKIFFNPGL